MENSTNLEESQTGAATNSSTFRDAYYESDFEFKAFYSANFIELIVSILCTLGYFASAICLIAHLYQFFHHSNRKRQNLARKNVASYCFSLLMFYVIMILANQVYFNGFVMRFYIRLASYFAIANSVLLLVISMDTFLSLRRCVQSLRIVTGPQWKRFVLYSLFGWGLPLGSFFDVIISNTPLMNGVFYGILVIRVIPMILLCLSVRYIKSATVKYANEDSVRKEIRIYWKLFLLTGILSSSYFMWIFVAYVLQSDNLTTDTVISLLSSFDGLFIYATFTCKEKEARKKVSENTQVTLNTLS